MGDSNGGELNRLRVALHADITVEVGVYKIGEDRCRNCGLFTFPLSFISPSLYHKNGF